MDSGARAIMFGVVFGAVLWVVIIFTGILIGKYL